MKTRHYHAGDVADNAAQSSTNYLSAAAFAGSQAAPRGYVPRVSAKLVARTRLLERLDQATSAALTLVVAPAGFGKTTLLASWMRHTRRKVAWISAEEHEGTVIQFFSQISTAVAQTAGTAAGGRGQRENSSASMETADWRRAVHRLVDQLQRIDFPLTIAIDDYHLIKDSAIQTAMVELVEHLPDSTTLLIASRTVPPLPLTRLRARGLLRQIDSEQLRFAQSESGDFLRNVMKLDLSDAHVQKLTDLMEGWIVGLQMAAIDILEGAEVDEIVNSNSSRPSAQHALDFLCEEVLDRQPSEVQEFLLKTSILDKMTAPLCDYITGLSLGDKLLDRLQAENLFIVPIDEKGKWVRYHHLFRSLLRQRLEAVYPGEIQELNRRASAWHERNNMLPEAVSYSLAASDWLNLAELMHRVGAPLLLETKPFRDWLRSLPRDALSAQPRLCSWLCWSLLAAGDIKGCQKVIQQHTLSIKANRTEYLSMKAVIAWLTLDGEGGLVAAREALELTQKDPVYHALSLASIGVCERILGKPELAQSYLSDALEIARQTGRATLNARLRYETYIGHAQAMQGRLQLALETIARVEGVARAQGAPVPPTVHIYRARIYLTRNQLDLASEELRRALEVTRKSGVELNTPLLWITIAMTRAALGDYLSALTTTDELSVWLRKSGNEGWLRAAATMRYAILLKMGHTDEVGHWLHANSNLNPEKIAFNDHDRYLLYTIWAEREARVNGNAIFIRPAIELAARLSRLAKEDKRVIDSGRSDVSLALLARQDGDIVQAGVHLDSAARALLTAGSTLVFFEYQAEIQSVLEALPHAGPRLPELAKLRELLGVAADPPSAASLQRHLVLISEREKEVLDLLAIGLTNQEIADNLVVSLNTIKTHIKNLYFKLDAHTRTQAVAAGRSAGLI